MSRRQSSDSSFDLFLDTICNTFGGILFLAILLAIMIQNRALVPAPEQKSEQPSPDELRAMLLKLDDLRSQRDSLQQLAAQFPEPSAASADIEFQEVKRTLTETEEKLTATIERRAQMVRQVAKQLEENAELREENEKVPRQLQELQQKLAAGSKQYATLVEAKKESLKIPRVSDSDRSSMLVLLTNHRWFLAFVPSVFGDGFDRSQVDVSRVFGGGFRIEPRPGAGRSANSAEGIDDFRSLVQRASRSGHILTVAVWPDSYGDFRALRELMIEENVRYDLWPRSRGESLSVTLGSGRSSVQ